MTGTLNLREAFGRVVDHAGESQADTSSARKIKFGDFLIDLVGRSATLRGRELELTSEEFDVLVFLAGHPQSMITPHTLLTTKAPRLRQTEFLRTLLSLRAKIDALAEPGSQYLRTESWIVYRFHPTPAT